MSESKSLLDKFKENKRIAIPSAVFVCLVLYLVVSLFISILSGKSKPEEKDINVYTICSYNGKKTMEVLGKEDRENKVDVYDYNFYGESLNLFFSEYKLGEMKPSTSLTGKTVALVDLCNSENIIKFEAIEETLENQIDLAKLTDGFYSVYLVNGETYNRVYMDSAIFSGNAKFETVVRDGKCQVIELIANRMLFNEENATEDYLDQAYLYIKVTTKEVDVTDETLINDTYDVVISTAPALTMRGVSLEGEKANGIVEAKEVYAVAETIKNKLEAAGLRVLIAKEIYNEYTLYYGEDGVLQLAYDLNAKYMVNLDMSVANSTRGIYYSAYTNGQFANAVLEALSEDTSLELKTVQAGLDNGFDDNFVVREAGGAVLGAGRYSETSAMNASFAQDTIFGINTLDIRYINIKSEADVNLWNKQRQAIGEATAKGILNYINRNVSENTEAAQ